MNLKIDLVPKKLGNCLQNSFTWVQIPPRSQKFAAVLELVYRVDLKSTGYFTREGSTPSRGTSETKLNSIGKSK